MSLIMSISLIKQSNLLVHLFENFTKMSDGLLFVQPMLRDEMFSDGRVTMLTNACAQ